MKKQIEKTLNSKYFPTAQFEHKTDNPYYLELKNHLEEICYSVESLLPSSKYTVEAHTAVGMIAACPWIGIHSTSELFDSSPRKGVYVTILWNYDGSGVCLSLQKGTDNSSSKEIVETVNRIRHKYGSLPLSKNINLYAPTSATRPKNYEKANVYGKNYTIDTLDSLKDDLLMMLDYYNQVVDGRVKNTELVIKQEIEEAEYQSPEPKKKTSSSNSWVRNPKIRAKALKKANYRCEVDGSHETFIIDKHYFMEGHHLIPMEYQELYPEQSLDIEENIVSLCPNCHRAIHYASVGDKFDLLTELYERRKDTLPKKIDINLETLQSFYDDI